MSDNIDPNAAPALTESAAPAQTAGDSGAPEAQSQPAAADTEPAPVPAAAPVGDPPAPVTESSLQRLEGEAIDLLHEGEEKVETVTAHLRDWFTEEEAKIAFEANKFLNSAKVMIGEECKVLHRDGYFL